MRDPRPIWRSLVAGARSRLSPLREADLAAVEAELLRLKTAFVAGDPRPLALNLCHYFGRETQVSFEAGPPLSRLSFRLTCDNDQFRFGFVPQPDLDEVANCVFLRFMGTLPLFSALERSKPPLAVDAVFNMNDEGVDDGVAFCAHRDTFTLVPDSFFLESRGYADARTHFQRHAVAWDDRRDVVLWRGASSGRPAGTNDELPRIALCRLCRSDTTGAFDVGLSAIVAQGVKDSETIRSEGLLVPPMPWSEFGTYRYHIDIDGHTNSWPGLMLKLLTGGLVFKVEPPFGHRQWYYDRLRPFENYVPVRSDMADLLELVGYFRSRQDLARRIGREGQRLALAMTEASEIEYGVRAIIARSVRDASRPPPLR